MTLSNIYQRIPKRYVLSLLGFFGLFNAFVLRSNISIAIVAMVTPTIDNSSDNMTIMIPAVYNWSTTTQGYILSSFFYGYCIAEILAGFLATRFAGRILFGGSVGLCACLTLFTPLCVQNGSGALIFLRFLEGISSVSSLSIEETLQKTPDFVIFNQKSCVYPSLHSIWSKWAPKQDKSKLATFAFSGAYIGTFVTMLFGGFIAADWSWEWQDTIPWKDIFTSLPVWAIITAHFGTNWVIYTMFTELPTFLVKSLDFRVDKAGLLSALPWLPLAISVYGAGFISDKLTEKYSTLNVRKFIMSISFTIIASGFLLITVLDNEDRALIVIGSIIVIGACGPAWASFGVNHLDIGGNYAAVLMGISNCFGSTPGFIVPLITGYIVQNSQLKREWNDVFIIPIFISVATLMFYTFFAAGELQPWALHSSEEHQRVLNNNAASRDINEHNAECCGTVADVLCIVGESRKQVEQDQDSSHNLNFTRSTNIDQQSLNQHMNDDLNQSSNCDDEELDKLSIASSFSMSQCSAPVIIQNQTKSSFIIEDYSDNIYSEKTKAIRHSDKPSSKNQCEDEPDTYTERKKTSFSSN
ncbi:unnamed protein product [Rotaria magnacalcarata]|uniref:Uncharacterized protein n=1 Tax=Rotaria magnacalcarata TaxID=392030 RepID=A0A819VCB5_9BILA|nr:unnamed protein product [Rotaria magnacalcarata]CAF4040409.1 unnamed protein product [Rotaria magnacalcarata]CAF4106755.1 unnamed protein product [Rotaria magnacalcarata]